MVHSGEKPEVTFNTGTAEAPKEQQPSIFEMIGENKPSADLAMSAYDQEHIADDVEEQKQPEPAQVAVGPTG